MTKAAVPKIEGERQCCGKLSMLRYWYGVSVQVCSVALVYSCSEKELAMTVKEEFV